MKSVALPVHEIIGGTQKNLDSPWIRPRSIFSQIFNGLLFGMTMQIYPQIGIIIIIIISDGTDFQQS